MVSDTGEKSLAKAIMKLTVVIILLTLATYPVFFVLYRVMIFQTVPRDDYAPYLLWIMRITGGALPGSPYVYRYLSILLAWPLYYLLPIFHLTNIPATLSIPYQRATAAFAMLSDIAAVASTVITFNIARNMGKTTLVALLSAILVYGGCWFTQIEGIDTVTIFGIVLAVVLLQKKDWYFLSLIIFPFINEKISIIVFLFLAIRCMTSSNDRIFLYRKLAISTLSLGVYACAIYVIHAKGNGYQLSPSGYLGNFIANTEINMSFRGILLSWGPSVLLLMLALTGVYDDQDVFFSRRDTFLIPALIVLALTLTEDFQVGRIVMMSVPLFAIPAAARLGQLFDRHNM